MKRLITLSLILMPALASARSGESNWKYEDRETLDRAFQVAGSLAGRGQHFGLLAA